MSMLLHISGYDTFLKVSSCESRTPASRNAEECHAYDRLVHTGRLVQASPAVTFDAAYVKLCRALSGRSFADGPSAFTSLVDIPKALIRRVRHLSSVKVRWDGVILPLLFYNSIAFDNKLFMSI
jgi:hypothetical protein